MGWINIGEAKRLEDGSQWELTIEDLCDLMANYPKAYMGRRKQREYATRAISCVMSNLERRGIIDDQFIDIRESAHNKPKSTEKTNGKTYICRGCGRNVTPPNQNNCQCVVMV